MSNILIYTSPARGHLYPMMDIAIALKLESHNVIIQTLSSEHDAVSKVGIEHRSISPKIEALPLEDYKYNNPISQIKATFSRWLSRSPFEIEDLEKTYYDINPDLLIIDVNCWGAAAFAEKQNKPWIMFMPYCLPIPSKDTPAFGPGFPPPTNLLDRLRDKFFRGITTLSFKSIFKKVDEFRVNYGVSKVGAWENMFEIPNLILYLTAEPFEYVRGEWPKNVIQVGPGLWDPHESSPGWVKDLPRPRILVSISTELQEDGKIIKAAIESLKDEDVSVIITSATLDPKMFPVPNKKFHISKFLPHSTIVPMMDLVITHGGMGTVQRALASGVPLCVIPWGRDQNETARRVEYSGAGVMIPKNKLNPKLLNQSVKIALAKKKNAMKVAESFKQLEGKDRALKSINEILKIKNSFKPERLETSIN